MARGAQGRQGDGYRQPSRGSTSAAGPAASE